MPSVVGPGDPQSLWENPLKTGPYMILKLTCLSNCNNSSVTRYSSIRSEKWWTSTQHSGVVVALWIFQDA